MKKYPNILLLCLFVCLLCSCASNRSLVPKATYQENAIHLHIKADPQMNLYNQVPHTLLVCIYQLKNPNGFNQRTGDNDDLHSLLSCDLFDNSVVSANRVIVHPGRNEDVVFDRAAGARYLAVVTGYHHITKERSIRLVPIPVVMVRPCFLCSKVPELVTVNMELTLGPQQIYNLKIKEEE